MHVSYIFVMLDLFVGPEGRMGQCTRPFTRNRVRFWPLSRFLSTPTYRRLSRKSPSCNSATLHTLLNITALTSRTQTCGSVDVFFLTELKISFIYTFIYLNINVRF